MEGMSPQVETFTQAEAIAELMDRAKRPHVPIRNTFVQKGTGRVRTPGPVAEFVTDRDEFGLDLYLLLHLVTAAADPSTGVFSTTIDAAGWVRSMGLDPSANNKTKVSKAFARLERRGLISRGRSGNRGRYTLLDEGGDGDAYEHPSTRGFFFKLPNAYWLNEWHLELGLPAKALLLISLSLGYQERFILPKRQAQNWYGISPSTTQKGLSALKDKGILTEHVVTKRSALSDTGLTTESRYALAGDFAQPKRQPKIVPITKTAG